MDLKALCLALVLVLIPSGVCPDVIITPGDPCACSTCETCSLLLSLAACDEVFLTSDIGTDINVIDDSCIHSSSISDKTLDCQGHVISPGVVNGNVGIWFDGVNSITVTNCTVTGWNKGVAIDSSPSINIQYSNVSGNRMGITFANSPNGAVISTVADLNFAFGLAFDTPSTSGYVSQSHICFNRIYDVYDLYGTGGSENNCSNVFGTFSCAYSCSGSAAEPGITVSKIANATAVWTGEYVNWTIHFLAAGVLGDIHVNVSDTNGFSVINEIVTDSYRYWTYVNQTDCVDMNNYVTVNASNGSAFYTESAWANVTVIHCGNGACDCGEDTIDCPEDCVPIVTLVSPANHHRSTTKSKVFTCNVTSGVTLDNITLHIWSTSAGSIPVINEVYNDTQDISDNSWEGSWSYTLPAFGTYRWNCEAYNTNGDSDWGDQNYTLTIEPDSSGNNDCDGEWVCGSWGSCDTTIDGQQTRSCQCKCKSGSGNPQCTLSDKPDETRTCECNRDSDCSAGECKVASCSDNRCTTHNKDDGTSCDDSDACTEGDICSAGSCSGTRKSCDDGNPCTSDSCTTAGDCAHTPDETATCDDGDRCTSGDRCSGGACTGGGFICECRVDSDCDDGKENTKDTCVNNNCQHERIDEEPPTPPENETEELLFTGDQPNWTEPEVYAEGNYSMDISVTPSQDTYAPGQVLQTARATIYDQEGKPVEGALVSGNLQSIAPLELSFVDKGDGVYDAVLDYTLSLDENSVIQLVATAVIDGQNVSGAAYLLIRSQEYFYLTPKKPTNDDVAPGQIIDFEAGIDRINAADVVETKSVVLIDERSNEETDMGPAGVGRYATSVRLKGNAHDTLYFIVLATATVNGVERQNAYREVLGKNQVLDIKFDKARQDTEDGLFALEVRYIDSLGALVNEQELAAKITSYPGSRTQELVLTRDEDVFIGTYDKKSGETSAEIIVWDPYYNRGYANMPPEFFSQKGLLEGAPLEYIAIVVIFMLGGFLAFRLHKGVAQKKADAAVRQASAGQRIEELENLIKRAKLDFYRKSISEEAANARIKEYEQELKLLKSRT